MFYFITLTTSGGLSTVQVEGLTDYFKTLADKCLLTEELHANGGTHLHAVCELATLHTANVTVRMAKLYERLDIPYVKGPSVKVKAVKDGTLSQLHSYVIKDVKPNHKPLICEGWSIKSLMADRVKQLKNLKEGDRAKGECMLHLNSVEWTVIEYAKRSALDLTDKYAFIDCVVQMQKEGYSFSRIKPTLLYCQVMARVGHTNVASNWWEGQLGDMI